MPVHLGQILDKIKKDQNTQLPLLKVKVAQLHLTFCHPMGYSLSVSSVNGILQARILEWVAVSFSGDLPNPGIEPKSPILQANSLPSKPPGFWRVGIKNCIRLVYNTTLGVRKPPKPPPARPLDPLLPALHFRNQLPLERSKGTCYLFSIPPAVAEAPIKPCLKFLSGLLINFYWLGRSKNPGW